ncbi:MAG: hypothetical protein WD672_07450 [Woeseia sp.]
MSTSIRILGWESEGLRCPDHKITFEIDGGVPSAVTLIQMPNGTGKTTTLNLLRGTLAGAFQDRSIWPKEKINQLQKKDSETDAGFFRADLDISGQRLTIIVKFDFSDGTAEYKTSFGSGQKTGFNPPSAVQRFFRAGFVNFFAFDGELAEQLLSHDHTDAERAIEDLFQLSIFERISRAVDDYWDFETASKTATEQRGLSRRQKRVQWLRVRLDELVAKHAEKIGEKKDIETELDEVREQFAERISSSQKKATYLQQKERDFQDSRNLVKSLSKELLAKMRLPVAVSRIFAGEVMEFKAGLDRVKLPESAAKEFFEELIDEEACVCGRPMDEAARKNIKHRAAQYLGSDEVILLNGLKSDVEQYIGSGAQDLNSEIQRLTVLIIEEVKRRQERQNALDLATLAVSRDDPVLRKAQDRIRQLEVELSKVLEEIRRYEDADDSFKDENTFGISIIQRRLEDAERKLAEITHTIEIKEKRDILHRILKSAHSLAREKLISDVVAESNVLIEKLMPHNNIRLQGIDHCLHLEGQAGGSVGETLCVAYAFLATLFAQTRHELPFVVDSPAGSIDLRVREQVAELVPKLSMQFIAFIISTEREGFLDALERSVGSDVQYITLFRSSVENAGITVNDSDTLAVYNDGKMVTGRHFFRGFQIDAENEEWRSD